MIRTSGILILILSVPFVYGQSIVDLVKAERQKNIGNPPSKSSVFTNSDLEKTKKAGRITSNSLLTSERPGRTRGKRSVPSENHWRNRILKIDKRIETLKLKIEHYDKELRTHALDLHAGNTRFFYRKAARLRNLDQRKQRAQADLALALEEKNRIETEAHKSGVLPGVLRGQKF